MVPVLFAASNNGEVMGIIILGLILTVGGFLLFQRITVVCHLNYQAVPPLVYLLRFACKLGAAFFGLCLLGYFVGR